MAVIFGSARHDEYGKLHGGKAGDQTGQEVATQTAYMHKKGWYALRPISDELANKLAAAMQLLCNNDNVGYDQYQRLGVVNNGIDSKVKTEADCSSSVRACLKYCGVDTPNFTTENEKALLLNTGLFSCVTIKAVSECYTGDILVTKTKGHTGIIVSGKARGANKQSANPYPVPQSSVRKGDKGDEVRWVQWELRESGYDLGKWGIDGDFGNTTYNKVVAFQNKYGLVPDGVVGKNTRDKMLAV